MALLEMRFLAAGRIVRSLSLPEKQTAPCSLVINVARGDVLRIKHTLPHILNSHKIQFAEVLIVIDNKPAEGRIRRNSAQYSIDDLYGVLSDLRGQGYAFKQEEVSYEADAVDHVYTKWFGRRLNYFRCAGGTPIYAFLYGVEAAQQPYRLHLDSDMLTYDPQPTSWVQEAMRVLDDIPDILFVNQRWGPHSADSPTEHPQPAFDRGFGPHVAQVFSTRAFLYNNAKLERAFLPMDAAQHPWPKQWFYRLRDRSPYRALEQMISVALTAKKVYRADLDAEWGYNIHAGKRSMFEDERIAGVIDRITVGDVPPAQFGQYNLKFDLFAQEEPTP